MSRMMLLSSSLVFTFACGGEELPGSYFDVQRKGTEDACTNSRADLDENLVYRLELKSNEVTLAVDENVFASGLSDGCTVNYNTIVWTTQYDGFAIDWRVDGNALVDPDGNDLAACQLKSDSDAAGLDWFGTEVYTITNSEHPDVSPGCTYTLEVKGDFAMRVD